MITLIALTISSYHALSAYQQRSEGLLLGDRRSEEIRRRLLGSNTSNHATSAAIRSRKKDVAKVRYAGNSKAVIDSPTGNGTTNVVVKPIPEITETSISYVAEIQVPILDEKGRKVEGQTVLVSVVDKKQATAWMPSSNLFASLNPVPLAMAEAKPFLVKDGKLDLKRIAMPSVVSIELGPQGDHPEWEIDGNVYSEALIVSKDFVADKTPKGDLVPGSRKTTFGPKTVDKYPGEGKYKGKKVKLTRTVETRSLVQPFQPIVLRRQVADFEIPKPDLLTRDTGATAKLFIGEQDEGTSGLKATDLGDRWAFQVRRDALEQKEDKTDQNDKDEQGKRDALVVQVETKNGSFGAEISLENSDFYDVNKLKQPELTLEAIANEGIEFAGKSVIYPFTLSPLQWNGTSFRPRHIISGDDALKMLEVKAKDCTVYDPTAGENHRGRYGRWFTIPNQDLMIRCRYDSDNNLKEKDAPILQEKVNGMLELIRVTGPRGGKIGRDLFVGATKEQVRDAFGRPDRDIPNLDKIGLKSSIDAAIKIYGDRSIEAPSETYLSGGIRIGYFQGKVAWFEVSRPLQLLYDGARAFVPDEARTLYIGEVTGSPANAVNALRDAIRSSAYMIGGMRVVGSESDADYVLTGHILGAASTRRVQHQYSYTVGSGKKAETRYANESFMCEVASANVQVSLQLLDRTTGASTRVPVDELRDGSGGHTNHQRCEVGDPNYLLASLCSRSKLESTIRRPLNNAGTTASNILGTVLATNYDNGKMLVNLGRRHGVEDKQSSEVSEMVLLLAHDVDLKTGEPTDMRGARVLAGKKMAEWLEVQEVGEDWAVVQLKRRGGDGRTVNAYGQIPRLLDPGSGLVRVQLAPKRGKK